VTGDPFGGRQGVEDHEQREPDGIAQHGCLLGIESLRRTHDGIREVGLQGRFAARRARSQQVEADPPDDRRQPGPQVVNLARVGAAQTEPGVLDGVVRLGHGAEQPKGDAAQVGAVCLEARGEPVLAVHASRTCRAHTTARARGARHRPVARSP
jgi:hypothetical protein